MVLWQVALIPVLLIIGGIIGRVTRSRIKDDLSWAMILNFSLGIPFIGGICIMCLQPSLSRLITEYWTLGYTTGLIECGFYLIGFWLGKHLPGLIKKCWLSLQDNAIVT